MKRRLLFFLPLLFLLMAAKNVVKGEYVILFKDGGEELLKKRLEKNLPDKITPMGHGHFLLKYKKDPGTLKLQKSLGEKVIVQPNYIYKSSK